MHYSLCLRLYGVHYNSMSSWCQQLNDILRKNSTLMDVLVMIFHWRASLNCPKSMIRQLVGCLVRTLEGTILFIYLFCISIYLFIMYLFIYYLFFYLFIFFFLGGGCKIFFQTRSWVHWYHKCQPGNHCDKKRKINGSIHGSINQTPLLPLACNKIRIWSPP